MSFVTGAPLEQERNIVERVIGLDAYRDTFTVATLRSGETPLAKWGKKLLRRKGAVNLAVAAMARKLAVAVWYLLMGRWTALEEIDKCQAIKVSKMISEVGRQSLRKLGKTRSAYDREICTLLKAQRVHVSDPNRKWNPALAGPTNRSAVAV